MKLPAVLPSYLAPAAGGGGGVRAGSLAASAAAALRAFSSVRATPQRLQLAAALLASAVVVAAAYQWTRRGEDHGARKLAGDEPRLTGGGDGVTVSISGWLFKLAGSNSIEAVGS
ncbi:Protein of unknown function [Gryllus bimaculatus]|nr:Protein of unknown function [Gryllus bimaculatus]